MKGVVLAGGTGSRLFPLTKVTNKHLLPVGLYPMIYHPLMRLRRAGVTQIAVVTSPEHMGDVVNLLGSGRELGLDLTFRVQDEPGGIAQAMALCENFVGGGPLVVFLGDNVLEDDITDDVAAFEAQGGGARVLLKEVHDPERYGVPRIESGRIVEVIEKPSDPPSHYSVTGIYMYDSEVFDVIRGLHPSRRGEYEVSDVTNHYASAGTLTHGVLRGWWGDAGTLEGWHEANRLADGLTYPELDA
ncbi:MAG: NTP transferase domain-containing protein [Rhodothermales bacterium]|nr:NTP transferase domain-containing protein [Rhodothermales bacterium]MBO6779728.1 NTP transferase domain-containing protein [Rhodothermales bacterium]